MKSALLRVCWWIWCALRPLLFLINNIYCIPCHVILMILLRPVLWLRPRLYWHIEGTLFKWLLNMVAMLSYTAGYDLVEMGDDIDRLEQRRCLFLFNHQSSGDVPLLMSMLTSRETAANHAMWIMDMMFKWTNFGLVSQLHRDFFIESGRNKRERSVQSLRECLFHNYLVPDRRWLLLFPEGGFLHKRKQVSQKYASKQGLPHLQHVTLPRVGAAQAIIDTLAPPSPLIHPTTTTNTAVTGCNGMVNGYNDTSCGAQHHLEFVVDVTIAYPDQDRPLSLSSISTGSFGPCSVVLFYRVFPISKVPRATGSLTDWLYQLYYDKEYMLHQYYHTHQFPHHAPAHSPLISPSTNSTHLSRVRRVRHDPLSWLLRNVFFIVVSSIFFHIYLVNFPV